VIRLAAVLFALTACVAPEVPPDAGTSDATTGPDPGRALDERGLELRNCPGGAFGFEGLYAVRFESTSAVSGGGVAAQQEHVTRYGVAQLCVEQREVAVDLLVCRMAITPVLHGESRTCAAESPGAALLAALPVAHFTGEIDMSGASVTLTGWSERWGLHDGAELPTEPSGIEQMSGDEAARAGVLDQDGDGEVGVTLRGDGEVPTRTFVARVTNADFALANDGINLAGQVGSVTAESVLGGPATRLIRPRERGPGGRGSATFVRADGLAGAPDIGVGDGVVQCAEVAAWIGTELAEPPSGPCER